MELTRVTVNDPAASYMDLVIWTNKHCDSYHRSNVTDVSDISYSVDLIYEFWFKDSKDATLFLLRWSQVDNQVTPALYFPCKFKGSIYDFAFYRIK